MKEGNKKKTQQSLEKENKRPPQAKRSKEEEEESNVITKPFVNLKSEPNLLITSKPIKEDSKALPCPHDEEDSSFIKDQGSSGKILVEIKPREDYLKDKISGLKVENTIIKGVAKSLEHKMKYFQNEIKNNSLQVLETSKDISQYLTSNEKRLDTEKQNRLFFLKELKTKENDLKNNIYQLTQNQKMLENDGYIDISHNTTTIANIDDNIRRDQIKEIKQTRETLTQRLDQINYQIKSLMNEELNDSNKKKVSIQSFLENFERDKELAEIRAKKYEQDSRARRQRMKKDINQLTVEMMNKIEKEEREEAERKMQKLQEMKKREKEQIIKRTTDNNQKLLKIKVFINEKPQDSTHYKEKEKEYRAHEEKRILTEANKRKAMMRSVSKEECDEFSMKFNENKIKTKEELEEKTIQLNELWKERKELLPQYTSPFFNNVMNEIKEEKKAKEEKEIEVLAHKKIKIDFGDEVKTKFRPPINRKLQRERRDRIMRLGRNKKLLAEEKKRQRIKKKMNQKKNRVLLKKRDPTQPSKCKWPLKLNLSDFTDNNSSIIKKPKQITLSKSSEKKKRVIPEKPINYLAEEKKKREMRSEQKKLSGQVVSNDEDKWNKILSGKNKKTLIENVNQVKLKAEVLEIEAKQKEQFLKLNGGSEKYPEIGEKVSKLLIDSIKAKLSILNSVSNTK